MFLARRRFTAHTYALKNTAVKVNRQRRADRSLWPPFFFFFSPPPPPRFFTSRHFSLPPRDARGLSLERLFRVLPLRPLFSPVFLFSLLFSFFSPTRSSATEAGSSLEADSKSVKPPYSRVTSLVASRFKSISAAPSSPRDEC